MCELGQTLFPLLYNKDHDTSQGDLIICPYYICLLQVYYAPGSDVVTIRWYYRWSFDQMQDIWWILNICSLLLSRLAALTDFSPGRIHLPAFGNGSDVEYLQTDFIPCIPSPSPLPETFPQGSWNQNTVLTLTDDLWGERNVWHSRS